MPDHIRNIQPKSIIEATDEKGPVHFDDLMVKRVHNILLVSSLYDSFTFEEDGRLNEVLFSEYLELNLRYTPHIERVPTADEALTRLAEKQFDLVISMVRVGGMDVLDFSRRCKELVPNVPIVLLAYHTRELPLLEKKHELPGIDRLFAWHGDVRLFLAIIKSIEDRMNVDNDVKVADVQCIILIEDSVSFYSSYLPMLYIELVKQTQDLMADGLNRMEKFLRMRARPKILLARSYEEGLELYRKYRDNVLGVITDANIPRNGEIDKIAGIDFARMVREETWDRAVLVQSANEKYRKLAYEIGAKFHNKNSPKLLNHLKKFIRENLGFGDFVFKMPDGSPIATAGDLNSMVRGLHEIPEESLIYHVSRNHFSLWLMARTEFDLARALRPRRVREFKNPEEIRQFLIKTFNEHSRIRRAGVVADFSADTFSSGSLFVRIGDGSLGGKGRCLAFIHSLLDKIDIDRYVPGVRVFVPPTTVLTTEVFERFMELNELGLGVLEETDEGKITRAFLDAALPDDAVNLLGHFLQNVRYPLAVRSSSLQEDASHQPFAGIYRTYMLANDSKHMNVRLEELIHAIKMVYASTYYNDPRSYFEATPNRLEEEQMAVLIQEVVGKRHDRYMYPDVAGIARSYDFYPVEGMSPEDGVVQAALGLGRQVVEGGKSVRFSPACPTKLFQFSSVEEFLENAQREFYALDLERPGPSWFDVDESESNIVRLGLDAAEKHGTLSFTGSTFVPDNDAVCDGTSREGIRLVTLAGILKHEVFPLAKTVKFLLDLGMEAFSGPVEIEFAANVKRKDTPHEFGFLQIRPMVIGSESFEIDLDEINLSTTVCVSRNALGQGYITGVRDVVYVKPDLFDRSGTIEIAGEIEKLNVEMRNADRPYILAGPGRWGTSDRFFGIPVSWSQISRTALFIETDIKGIAVEPSQGAHFFHNITSMGIPYLNVNLNTGDGFVDYAWLDKQTAVIETEHIRLVRFDTPLEIAVDWKGHRAVVLKPGESLPQKAKK